MKFLILSDPVIYLASVKQDELQSAYNRPLWKVSCETVDIFILLGSSRPCHSPSVPEPGTGKPHPCNMTLVTADTLDTRYEVRLE